MANVAVNLTKEADGSWSWSATLPDGQSASGEGFESAQEALEEAARHDSIKDESFYGVAKQDDLMPPAQPVSDFDPSQHTVAEVNKHLASASPAELQRVLNAEAEGKARVGIMEAWDIEVVEDEEV
jgi:hypothetical protein